MSDGRRLIEDFLPIQAISAEASREKSVRKGHISTLHLWWARRPLVACRAAVYGALVPASRFIPPACRDEERGAGRENGLHGNGKSLGRANAAKFVKRLCRYPSNSKPEQKADIERAIKEAQRHILEAHAERLTRETGLRADTHRQAGRKVTVKDIEEGRAPRPKVLDMFAGGGAIPLEALRLGCEAYALDLNPVAHIIELCTLLYPQKYGKPDPNARGMTGLPAPRRYWAYIIKCSDNSFYIGQTDNLLRRYEDHLKGKVEWTADRKPLELVYWEAFDTREEAAEREKWLKTGFGRKWIKREYEAGHLSERQAGPKNSKGLPASLEGLAQPGETTWGGLAEEVRYWGNWVLKKVKAEIGDLYPLIPDPEAKKNDGYIQTMFPLPVRGTQTGDPEREEVPPGYLVPVAYLWTRTVRCKNPSCGATVPLVKQTWLCKKKGGKKSPGRYVALKVIAPKDEKKVRFEVVEATTEKGLGFDPSVGSKGGNATCPFCGTVADSGYVKAEGCAKRMGQQMMAIVCTRPGTKGKVYISADDIPEFVPDDEIIRKRIEDLCKRTGLTVPGEPMPPRGTLGFRIQPYGIDTWGDLFTPRQMLCLLAIVASVRQAEHSMQRLSYSSEHVIATTTFLAAIVDRLADFNSTLCVFNYTGGRGVVHTFGRHALPMVWDFAETNPFNPEGASLISGLEDVPAGLRDANVSLVGDVQRGSATGLPWTKQPFDAVITDPPYYDNVPYADISDFFYVWLKRTVGHLYPEHFSTEVTPKKSEAVAESMRHNGDRERAKHSYEEMMSRSFSEANRVLKPGGQMTVVYAHKTTLGWATLVDALREAGFIVTEAWPLDTEKPGRLRAQESAALASSIFLVARKREGNETGSYEDEVQSELDHIVRERVDTLWKMGITGADLVIAAVGAGLRAFTRFARVEYANGEEVPAEKFLAEVEGVVLETLLEKIFGVAGLPAASRNSAAQTGSGIGTVDGPTRFYVLWRYTYKAAEMDAGEAIVFTYGQNVELDGQNGLSSGSRALVEKKKGKYRLYDFTERGNDEKLGMPGDDGTPAPLIDALHRILWLIENEPRNLNRFLDEARPDRERLRLVAQALAGTALAGKKDDGAEHLVATTASEQAALKKLVANWRALIDQRLAASEGTLFDLGRK